MTSPSPVSPTRTKAPEPETPPAACIRAFAHLTLQRAPVLLLLMYAGLMIGLTQVADSWIVALAITPLVFALLISLGCLLAYRRDFYA